MRTRLFLIGAGALLAAATVPGGGTPPPCCVPCTPTPQPIATPAPDTGFGAWFLGTEPKDGYRKLADIGADWVAIRTVSAKTTGKSTPKDAGDSFAWPKDEVQRAKAAGLKVLLVSWIGDDDMPDGDCGSVRDPDEVRTFSRRLVAATEPDAFAYGWEPDGCSSGYAWAPVAMAAYEGAKDGHSRTSVVVGLAYERFSPAGPFDAAMLPDMVVAANGRAFADIIAVSGFDDFHARWWPPGLVGKRRDISAELAKYRLGMDIAMVGGGLPSWPPDRWTDRSETLQASAIRRTLVECAEAEMSLCILYRAFDQEGEWAQFGLFRSDGTPKPSAAVFASAVRAIRRGEDVPCPECGQRDRIGRR